MQPSKKLSSPIVLSASAIAAAVALSNRFPGTYDDIARIGGLKRSAPAHVEHYATSSPEVKAMVQPTKKSKKAKAKAKKAMKK